MEVQNPVPQGKKAQANEFWQFIAEFIKTALIVAVLAVTIRTFVIQPFMVEGLSMYPQFHDKDYLIVDKLSYRIQEPRRGDIIVFRYPQNPKVNYVKRIIGLPGEKVRIENSTVTVINTASQEKILQEPYISSGNETLVNGKTERYEFTVADNSYFVLGDNRQGSSDSRDWGMVPDFDVVGRVLVLAYPFENFSLAPHASYN